MTAETTAPEADEHEGLIQAVKAALVEEINQQVITSAGVEQVGLDQTGAAAAKARDIFETLDMDDLAEVAVGRVGQWQATKLKEAPEGVASAEQAFSAAVRLKTLEDTEKAYAEALHGSPATPEDVAYAEKYLKFACQDEKVAKFHRDLFGPWFARELRTVRESGVREDELYRLLVPDWERRMRVEGYRQEHYTYLTDDDGKQFRVLLAVQVRIIPLEPAE